MENYERIGRFIYSAHRHGSNQTDIHDWMADDLGIPRPNPGDDLAAGELYAAFFAKYAREDEFQANYQRFLKRLKDRDT